MHTAAHFAAAALAGFIAGVALVAVAVWFRCGRN
jgi:hypothetical protein